MLGALLPAGRGQSLERIGEERLARADEVLFRPAGTEPCAAAGRNDDKGDGLRRQGVSFAPGEARKSLPGDGADVRQPGMSWRGRARLSAARFLLDLYLTKGHSTNIFGVRRGFRPGRQQIALHHKTKLGQMLGHEKLQMRYFGEIREKNDRKLVELRDSN